MNKRVSVIGSGIGGLASAVRLANRGYEVSVFEKNSVLGGKVSEVRRDGFRWDAGPSLFTLPEVLDDLFTLCGEDPSDFYRYDQLPVITRYYYPEGKEFNAWSDVDRFVEELKSQFGEPEKNLRSYFKSCKAKYDLTEEIFLKRSMHRLSTYFRRENIKTLLNLYKLQPFSSMNKGELSGI